VNRINLMLRDEEAFGLFAEEGLSLHKLSASEANYLMNDNDWERYVIQTLPQGGTWFFAFNFGSTDANVAAAFQNANFRRAVFAAINRNALIGLTITENREDFLTNTISVPQVSFNARNRDYMSFGALPGFAERQNYNSTQAMVYLRQAVEELGENVTWPVTLVLPRRMTEFGIMESELYRQMIEAALYGYIVVDFRTYTHYWERDDLLARGELDIGLTYVGHNFGDPSAVLGSFAPNGFAFWLFYFEGYEGGDVLNEMFMQAAAQTEINARFSQFAAFEVYLIENALVLPFKRSGGEFVMSRDLRPFNSAFAEYGLSRFLFLDRAFGEPLTAAEFSRKYEQYMRELGYLAR